MKRIHFNEVVTRDGFQIEPNFIATDAKVALIDELSQWVRIICSDLSVIEDNGGGSARCMMAEVF